MLQAKGWENVKLRNQFLFTIESTHMRPYQNGINLFSFNYRSVHIEN